jgi:hypothetical protein
VNFFGRRQRFGNQNDLHKNLLVMRKSAQFLNRNEAISRLLPHARLLQRLGNALATTIPGQMAGRVRIANLRQATVIMHADNAAVAAKLRQMTGKLLEQFSRICLECNKIEIKVQPIANSLLNGAAKTTALFPASDRRPPSPRHAEKLLSMAEELPPGAPLAEALRRLASRSTVSPS